MKAALPGMAARGYGREVNISSVHALVASANKAPYVAAKFGLIGLSRVAALEYASAGTREQGGATVNCIGPGWTETAIIEPQIVARAAEIGQLTAWLCHPIAHNITGAAIPLEVGMDESVVPD